MKPFNVEQLARVPRDGPRSFRRVASVLSKRGFGSRSGLGAAVEIDPPPWPRGSAARPASSALALAAHDLHLRLCLREHPSDLDLPFIGRRPASAGVDRGAQPRNRATVSGRQRRARGTAGRRACQSEAKVIVAASPPAVRAVQRATSSIPVVMFAVTDPVSMGFASHHDGRSEIDHHREGERADQRGSPALLLLIRLLKGAEGDSTCPWSALSCSFLQSDFSPLF
jgi:hypothetical protein